MRSWQDTNSAFTQSLSSSESPLRIFEILLPLPCPTLFFLWIYTYNFNFHYCVVFHHVYIPLLIHMVYIVISIWISCPPPFFWILQAMLHPCHVFWCTCTGFSIREIPGSEIAPSKCIPSVWRVYFQFQWILAECFQSMRVSFSLQPNQRLMLYNFNFTNHMVENDIS